MGLFYKDFLSLKGRLWSSLGPDTAHPAGRTAVGDAEEEQGAWWGRLQGWLEGPPHCCCWAQLRSQHAGRSHGVETSGGGSVCAWCLGGVTDWTLNPPPPHPHSCLLVGVLRAGQAYWDRTQALEPWTRPPSPDIFPLPSLQEAEENAKGKARSGRKS